MPVIALSISQRCEHVNVIDEKQKRTVVSHASPPLELVVRLPLLVLEEVPVCMGGLDVARSGVGQSTSDSRQRRPSSCCRQYVNTHPLMDTLEGALLCGMLVAPGFGTRTKFLPHCPGETCFSLSIKGCLQIKKQLRPGCINSALMGSSRPPLASQTG